MGIYKEYIKLKEQVFDMEHTIISKMCDYLLERGLLGLLKDIEISKGLLSDRVTLVFDEELSEKEINKFAKTFGLRLIATNHNTMDSEDKRIVKYIYYFKSLDILRLGE